MNDLQKLIDDPMAVGSVMSVKLGHEGSTLLWTDENYHSLSDLRRIVELQAQNAELLEVVNAVAHIGVDFGFGPYELQPEDIEKARTLLAKGESND